MSGPQRYVPVGCAEVEDLAEEFALGLLDGAERAAVVGHLDGCRNCRAQIADLAETAEQMLLVAPRAEPSAGFEQRVLARLGPPPARRRPRWLGTALALAAALVLVLGTATLVTRLADDQPEAAAPPEPDPPVELTATLWSTDRQFDYGDAVLVLADREVVELDMAEWMERVADWDEPPPGPWTLDVARGDGAREEYLLALANDPQPQVLLRESTSPVTDISITDGAGKVWCTAEFR